jgi:hypothetical protein
VELLFACDVLTKTIRWIEGKMTKEEREERRRKRNITADNNDDNEFAY